MFPKQGDPGMFERPAPVGFIFEPKLEGTRIFIYKDEDNIAIVNQQGIDITFKFPELLDLPIYIKAKNCVLDAVLTVLKDGKPDSLSLQKRELAESKKAIEAGIKNRVATVFMIDVLEVNGVQLADEWLKKRKEILASIIKESDLINLIPYSLNGRSVWQQVKEKNYSGIIAKAIGSRYSPAQGWSWLKVPNFKTLNAVIIGFKEKAILLGAYKNKELKFLTEILKKDIDKKTLSNLNFKMKKFRTKKKTVFSEIQASWLKPVLTVKLKYDSFKDNTFENLEILRQRFDLISTQCIVPEEL